MLVLANDWSDLNTWVTLFTLIGACIGLIAGLIPVIIKLVKAFKVIVKNKQWTEITEAIKKAITAAEASGKTGAEKKTMVIKAAQEFCKSIDVDFTDDLAKQISDFIDTTITFVNDMKK